MTWDYPGHVLRYAIMYFEKNTDLYPKLQNPTCLRLFQIILNSNGWCKFIVISIYKITEDHTVAVR